MLLDNNACQIKRAYFCRTLNIWHHAAKKFQHQDWLGGKVMEQYVEELIGLRAAQGLESLHNVTLRGMHHNGEDA